MSQAKIDDFSGEYCVETENGMVHTDFTFTLNSILITALIRVRYLITGKVTSDLSPASNQKLNRKLITELVRRKILHNEAERALFATFLSDLEAMRNP